MEKNRRSTWQRPRDNQKDGQGTSIIIHVKGEMKVSPGSLSETLNQNAGNQYNAGSQEEEACGNDMDWR
jgi:hypothetical protein